MTVEEIAVVTVEVTVVVVAEEDATPPKLALNATRWVTCLEAVRMRPRPATIATKLVTSAAIAIKTNNSVKREAFFINRLKLQNCKLNHHQNNKMLYFNMFKLFKSLDCFLQENFYLFLIPTCFI